MTGQRVHIRRSSLGKPFRAGTRIVDETPKEETEKNLLDSEKPEVEEELEQIKEDEEKAPVAVDVKVKELEDGGIEVDLTPSGETSEEEED